MSEKIEFLQELMSALKADKVSGNFDPTDIRMREIAIWKLVEKLTPEEEILLGI